MLNIFHNSHYLLIYRSGLRFLDTLSLHVCVSGLENSQKGQWLQADQCEQFDKKWMKVGSPNALSVRPIHCFPLYLSLLHWCCTCE